MIEIEIQKKYKLSLTDHQVRQLYNLLLRLDNSGTLKYDAELIPVLQELRKLFPGATQPESKEHDLPYFVGN
jgi:uncharacterized protein YpuA (DUF1002 family)